MLNEIADNQVLRNHWGILINSPSTDATANTISGNTVHDNGRAGIAILSLTARGNSVTNNNATGNGLLNLAPSLRFDLFAANLLENSWRNNSGAANFTTSSMAIAAAAVAAEAFGPAGCMGTAGGTP